jgi:hypothetical protein
LVAAGLGLALAAGGGCAARSQGAPASEAALPAVPEPFSAGTWQIVDYGGIGVAKHGEDDLAFLGIGGGYHVLDGLSLNLELLGYVFDQGDHNPVAGGVNLLSRWHFLRSGPFSVYVDGAVGASYAERSVPENGTRYNFTPQAGGGMTFRIGNGTHLMAGGRFLHFSNAGLSENNPGTDLRMFYVGVALGF